MSGTGGPDGAGGSDGVRGSDGAGGSDEVGGSDGTEGVGTAVGSDGADGRPSAAEIDASSPVGTVVGATLDGEPVTVVHHADGWVAVDDECTHAACPFSLDGEVFDGTVLGCNCHGSEFDLRTGEVLLGPAERALTVRPLVVVDGRLTVGPSEA